MLSGRTIQRTLALAFTLSLWLPAPAQDVDARLAASRRHGAAAVQALQAKDVAAALKALGEAADSSPGIHPRENDGLSVAAGGLHLALAQLSSDEQFDLLYAWSMPSDSRRAVRILTTITPHDAPPKEFARVLGERPRDTSFPISQIGGVRGLFSTGWALVVAADDIGRLRRLTAELEQLAEKKTPHADVLLMLAKLAERRGDPAALSEGLQQRAAALRMRLGEGVNASSSVDPSDIVLAAAALRHESLRPISEEIFKLLIDSTNKDATRLRPFLRIAHATAAQLHHGESGPETLYESRLKYWIATSGATAATESAGAPRAMWLTHEDHILHLAGPGNDVLFFRYPLTGEFDFTCETQVGGEIGTEGGLLYGGLHFEALGSPEVLNVWDGDLAHQVRRPCVFVRQESRPIFNRVSIRSTDEGAVFAANLHPVWFDGPSSKTSPWLGLRSFGERRPLFRNLKITGSPVIPREVRLADGDHLRGWQTGFFGETQPPFTGASPPGEQAPLASPAVAAASPAAFDWSIHGGVIRAARREAPDGTTSQSLLKYHRPLLEGESVSYEFRYQPGQYDVHPALGRLAFLIEPNGVRIHWITSGELDWTGLPADNVTLEPLNRRGPRPLPLKEDDWNHVVLARASGKATVTLNGQLIYERPVDFGGDLTFGLYRDAAQSAAEVRNIVMTGEWPESLPEEFLQNPAAVVSQLPSDADRHVLNRAAGGEFLAEDVRRIRRQAASLGSAERFEYLARWILPAADHPGFRISGEFTPTDPSPLAVKLEPERFASPRGGELVSPVFDLLDAAAETERLEELRNRIAAVPESADEHQQRAKAALLLLVNLAIGDEEEAASACVRLQELVLLATPATAADMWPETLAVHRGLQHFHRVPAVGDLLNSLYSRRTQRSFPGGCENWHARITFLMERYRRLAAGVTEEELEASTHFDHWVSVQRVSARARGDGFPHTVWLRSDGDEAFHLSGHHEDYLFFRTPLRGDFQIVGDIGPDATTQLYVAGRYFGPRWRREEFETGLFRQGHWIETISPPFAHLDPWIRFRAVVRDRIRTIYINGRPVHSEELPEHHEPWFGPRAWSRAVARLRSVQIAGDPHIPDEVVISASEQLLGWVPYFDEPAEGEWAVWRHHGDAEIHGLRREELAGSLCESLLGYHRPLVEDGAIEYEFYYEPDQVLAHPALDRLAFLLTPEGVRIHWITDGRYDRTEMTPDNVFDEPQNRRGPAMLPLREGDWNQLKLSIAGETVCLHLNGHLVYERALEPTNRRTFGLFYYSGRNEARVRNIVMRGDWPKVIPPPAEMELGDAVAGTLDADLPRLKAVFTHDFAKDGLSEEYFRVGVSAGGGITPREDGVLAVRAGAENWPTTSLKLPFSAVGDFDLEASFHALKIEADKDSVAMMLVNLDDPQQHQCRLLRIRHLKDYQRIEKSLSVLHPTGGRSYSGNPLACEAVSGTLRIARRGATVYYLFAEEESRAFQSLGTHVLSDAPMKQEGIELHALCHGVGETQVLWKSISLRAEQLKYLPPGAQPERGLYVMNADGSNPRRLAGPAPGFTHLGSPEWSADGERIALDMSQGSVATSHIVLVSTNDGELEDIGPGCMPSFSPDGKRIAFSHSGEGVMLMKSDGSNRKVIDSAGWGVQWSPDGKHLAYGKSGNVVLMNPDTRQQRLLLNREHAARYSQIYWNLGWSHDSRWIAFKAQNRDSREYELAVAGIGPAEGLRVLYKTTGSLQADFTWAPDNRRVVFAMHSPIHQESKLFQVRRTASAAPELFPNQPEGHEILGAAWSPDGRHITFAGQTPPQPVAWPLATADRR